MNSDKTPERRHPHKPNGPQTDPADQELFRLYVECEADRSRSDQLYTLIYRKFYDEVLRICRRVLHHYQDAEDAAQNTFLVLHRRRKSVRPHNLRSFLWGIAVRRALKIRERRHNHRPITEELEEVLFAPASGLGDESLREDRLRAIRRALKTLGKPEQELLILHYAAGFSAKAMADHLHVRPDAVRKRISRALGRVRGHLRRAGFDVPRSGGGE